MQQFGGDLFPLGIDIESPADPARHEMVKGKDQVIVCQGPGS